jgi:hypothetical protein
MPFTRKELEELATAVEQLRDEVSHHEVCDKRTSFHPARAHCAHCGDFWPCEQYVLSKVPELINAAWHAAGNQQDLA